MRRILILFFSALLLFSCQEHEFQSPQVAPRSIVKKVSCLDQFEWGPSSFTTDETLKTFITKTDFNLEYDRLALSKFLNLSYRSTIEKLKDLGFQIFMNTAIENQKDPNNQCIPKNYLPSISPNFEYSESTKSKLFLINIESTRWDLVENYLHYLIHFENQKRTFILHTEEAQIEVEKLKNHLYQQLDVLRQKPNLNNLLIEVNNLSKYLSKFYFLKRQSDFEKISVLKTLIKLYTQNKLNYVREDDFQKAKLRLENINQTNHHEVLILLELLKDYEQLLSFETNNYFHASIPRELTNANSALWELMNSTQHLAHQLKGDIVDP